MKRANLRGAIMLRTNLASADLERSDLREAKLVAANLKNAILRHADLQDTNLTNANLEGADSDCVKLDTAIFNDNLLNELEDSIVQLRIEPD